MIVGIWGEDKSCKSTLALSAPKPMIEMEFDIGGFDRACRNLPHLPIKDWYDSGLITLEQFPIPPQGIQISKNGQVSFTASKTITGIKELFYHFASLYFSHLREPELKTVSLETGTLLYNTLICDGYLQELQEKQLQEGKLEKGERLRTQLQQQEYKEPYDRMRGIIYAAKTYRKQLNLPPVNLILTHHASDEYKPMPQKDGSIAMSNTGKRIRHGWNQLGDSVDLMIHTYTKQERELDENGKPVIENGKPKTKLVPYGKVELASVLELVDVELREPTINDISTMISMIRGEF